MSRYIVVICVGHTHRDQSNNRARATRSTTGTSVEQLEQWLSGRHRALSDSTDFVSSYVYLCRLYFLSGYSGLSVKP